MEYKDYYKILGVSRNADDKEIKSAYRKLARQYHPDKNPGDTAAEDKFKEINEAYEVLGNPENRSMYNRLGANYQRYRQQGGAPGGFDFSQFGGAGGNINIDGFSSFFNSIFGQQRSYQQAQPVGQTLDHEVEIMLEEAYHGTQRTLVRQDGERITAKIPRGAKNGTKIRLRGKGMPGPGGAGDIMIHVKLRPHKQFKRDNENLSIDVPVDFTTAALGGKVLVPTLAGDVNLTIPPGTQGGSKIRLTGKGMPKLRTPDSYGNLLVRMKIRVPKQLSAEQKALLEQWVALEASEPAGV